MSSRQRSLYRLAALEEIPHEARVRLVGPKVAAFWTYDTCNIIHVAEPDLGTSGEREDNSSLVGNRLTYTY